MLKIVLPTLTKTEDKKQGKNRLVKGCEKFLRHTNVHRRTIVFRLSKSCGEERSRPTGRRCRSGQTKTEPEATGEARYDIPSYDDWRRPRMAYTQDPCRFER